MRRSNKRKPLTDAKMARKTAYMRKYLKRWREDNHDYDMLRKTIAAINECGDEEKQSRKNEAHRKWLARKPQRYIAEFRKRHAIAALEWHYRQMNDPELGEFYRQIYKPITSFFTKEMKEAARAKYDAIMERRKEQRRKKRIDRLIQGCTTSQKSRVRVKLSNMRRGRV